MMLSRRQAVQTIYRAFTPFVVKPQEIAAACTRLFGDADGNGSVDPRDLTITANVLVGNGVPPAEIPQTVPVGQVISDIYYAPETGFAVIINQVDLWSPLQATMHELLLQVLPVQSVPHPSLGEFVETVAGIRLPMGTARGWVFSVNNRTPLGSGVSAQTVAVRPNDNVSWRRV